MYYQSDDSSDDYRSYDCHCGDCINKFREQIPMLKTYTTLPTDLTKETLTCTKIKEFVDMIVMSWIVDHGNYPADLRYLSLPLFIFDSVKNGLKVGKLPGSG